LIIRNTELYFDDAISPARIYSLLFLARARCLHSFIIGYNLDIRGRGRVLTMAPSIVNIIAQFSCVPVRVIRFTVFAIIVYSLVIQLSAMNFLDSKLFVVSILIHII
jgi:hypothetical protein